MENGFYRRHIIRHTWLRTVEEDLRQFNRGLASGLRRAQNRTAWRTLTGTATSPTSSDWWWWWWWYYKNIEWCFTSHLLEIAPTVSFGGVLLLCNIWVQQTRIPALQDDPYLASEATALWRYRSFIIIIIIIIVPFLRYSASNMLLHNSLILKSPSSPTTVSFIGVLLWTIATPDYGLGTVGKCLGPTTSKGPTKDGCKICWTDVSQSVTNGLCIVSTKLSILALKHQFHQ